MVSPKCAANHVLDTKLQMVSPKSAAILKVHRLKNGVPKMSCSNAFLIRPNSVFKMCLTFIWPNMPFWCQKGLSLIFWFQKVPQALAKQKNRRKIKSKTTYSSYHQKCRRRPNSTVSRNIEEIQNTESPSDLFLYRSSYPDPKLLPPNWARWRKCGAFWGPQNGILRFFLNHEYHAVVNWKPKMDIFGAFLTSWPP